MTRRARPSFVAVDESPSARYTIDSCYTPQVSQFGVSSSRAGPLARARGSAVLMGLPTASHRSAADVDAGSRYGIKPLPPVTMHGAHGASTDETLLLRAECARRSTRSQHGWMEAVERGEMVRISQLLDEGQQIDEVCAPGHSTALYVASRTNSLRVAELLLSRGADPAVLTPDGVSPAWIAISRGFSEMLELLLDPRWSSSLTVLLKTETRESLQKAGAGVQETHYELACMRRYYRCVHLLETVLSIDASRSKIPNMIHELPSGWATGFAPAEPGQRADMPMQPFYWKAFTTEQCVTQPPEGAKELKHNGDGTFG